MTEKVRQFNCNELSCATAQEATLSWGSFGVVLFGFHDTHHVVALKCFGTHSEKHKQEKVKSEVECLQYFNHKNVIRFLGWTQWSNVFAIITEYLPAGDLKELVDDKDVKLTPLIQLRMCTEISDGLSFVHSQKRRNVHGDISPEKILLTETLSCKISHFSSAKISSHIGGIATSGGSNGQENKPREIYASPELINQPLKTIKPSDDVYSFSILVYIVLGRQPPNVPTTPMFVFKAGIQDGQRPDLEHIFEYKSEVEKRRDPDDVRALEILMLVMKDCWKHNPQDRPKMIAIKDRLYAALNKVPSCKIEESTSAVINDVQITKPLKEQYKCIPLSQLDLFSKAQRSSGLPILESTPTIKNSSVSPPNSQELPQENPVKIREFDCDELTCADDLGVCELGRGGFGVVISAFHDIHQVVALKCFEMSSGRCHKGMEKKIKSEVECLQNCNHENVIRILGWTQWWNVFAIITEFLPAGELKELVDDKDVKLTPLVQLRMCTEISNGLSFVHNFSEKQRLVHGDIKVENVLLTETLSCKISDFGSAKISSHTGGRTTTRNQIDQENDFTEIYASPELINQPLKKIKPSDDVYSFSILVYIVLGRQPPIVPTTPMFVYKAGIQDGQRPDLEHIIEYKSEVEKRGDPDDVRALEILMLVMKDCWKHNPQDRPKMIAIKDRLYAALNKVPSCKVEESTSAVINHVRITKPLKKQYKCIPLSQLDLFSKAQQLSTGGFDTDSSGLPIGKSNASRTKLIQSKSSDDAKGFHDNFTLPPSPLGLEEESFTKRKEGLKSNKGTDVHQLLKSIQTSLDQKKISFALSETDKLISAHNILIISAGLIIDDVISISKLLIKQSKCEKSVSLILWTLTLCEEIKELEAKFEKIFQCCQVLNAAASALVKADVEIRQRCCSAFATCRGRLESIEIKTDKHKAAMKIWCSLYLARSYCACKMYQQSIEVATSCLRVVASPRYNNVNKSDLKAFCYDIKACANHKTGKFKEAVKLRQREISAIGSAMNINEERKQWIAQTRKNLQKSKVALRVMI